MKEIKSSYRQILKATSVFGGVQVFEILIRIIRSKFIAVLLGPSGLGFAELLGATTRLIAGLTNFGLEISAVKNIAAACGSGNEAKISTNVIVIRRLVWSTGLLGSILTLVFSSWLSELTFGNKEYTFAFIWISITLLLNQISTGQKVILRGLRKIKYLAQATIIGSVLGLITTIPLYYYYGLDGIVPGIIVTSIISLLLSWYFAKKIDIQSIYVSYETTIAKGKGMLKMGFMFSLSGLITLGVSYIVRIYISNTGGLDQVGLYNSGFAIINSYVGMIFTAMSTDYFPRLAAVADNNKLSQVVINQQAEVSLLILAPVIIVFLVFIDWAIIVLYSVEFLAVNELILWAILGIFFKAASWAMGFIFLAKGDSKMFFWNELIFNFYLLALNLIGYYFLGLAGLGISFLVSYILYTIQVYIVTHKNYNFSFNRQFFKIFILQLLLAVSCLGLIKLVGSPYSYVFGSLIICISGFYTYRELDKRMNLKSIFAGIKNKFKSK